jgi:hypothetical protein
MEARHLKVTFDDTIEPGTDREEARPNNESMMTIEALKHIPPNIAADVASICAQLDYTCEFSIGG